jgi:hypothetical protein
MTELLVRAMKTSTEFVYPKDKTLFEQHLQLVGAAETHSLGRQYVHEELVNPVLRLSALGKTPAFELVGKKLGLIKQAGKHTLTEQHRLLFCIGDFIENWLYFTFLRIGYEVVEQQTDIYWQGVHGHIDFIIKDEKGQHHLIECKSANDYYFTQVKKFGIGDERGYLTQLLTYDACMRDKYPDLVSSWVFVNKNTSELCVIPLLSIDEGTRTEALRRANSVVRAYNKATEPDDCYKLVQPPPPSIEKTKTGVIKYWADGKPKLYCPSVVSHPDFCYVLNKVKNDYGKIRDYVVDYNYPEHLQDFKPNVVEQALAYNS